MKLRKFVLATAVLGLFAIPAATANAAPAEKATGSVGLSGPLQYVSFNAHEGAPAKGEVNYTNFDFDSTAPTGVYDARDWTSFTTHAGGSDYAHTIAVTSFVPTSPTSSTFTATGAGPGVTWTATGTINGSTINWTLDYDNSTYTAYGTGTINPDGSAAGAVTDSVGTLGATWDAPIGSFPDVLSYTAKVTCANVTPSVTATFGWTIPTGSDLAGTNVIATVTDGGSPGAGNDTWNHNVGTSCAAPVVGPYTITSGNLVVHKK